jgi:hypothetical protein
VKIDILHRQVDLLHQEVSDLHTQVDRDVAELRKETQEAEERVTLQLQQLASQLRGERIETSRVDARGFGPIAGGIILTGLSDELANIAVFGWLVVIIFVGWIIAASRGWLRDYKEALRRRAVENE